MDSELLVVVRSCLTIAESTGLGKEATAELVAQGVGHYIKYIKSLEEGK